MNNFGRNLNSKFKKQHLQTGFPDTKKPQKIGADSF